MTKAAGMSGVIKILISMFVWPSKISLPYTTFFLTTWPGICAVLFKLNPGSDMAYSGMDL